MYIHEVVGFDVREMWLNTNQLWSIDQRNRFLLRDDVIKPLSVDSYIWYSIFSEIIDPHLWALAARDAQYTGTKWDEVFSEAKKLSMPDIYSPRRVWRNLIQLKDYVNSAWGDSWKPSWLISVAEVIEDTDIMEPDSFDPITPSEVDSTWELLGYDVADYELITGLFEGEIDPSLKPEWKNQLNEHHLFIEPQKAFDYIEVANKRYPSHMPYGVYALYLVEKHE